MAGRVAAFLLVFLASGCIGNRVDGGSTFSVAVDLGDEEDLYKASGTTLTIDVTSHIPTRLEFGVGIPKGVTLLEGNPTFAGSMAQDDERSLRVRVRADAAGEHVFTAWASNLSNCLDGTVSMVNLQVSGSASGAKTTNPGSRAAPATLDARLASQSGEVRVTTSASQDFAAEVCLTTWFTAQKELTIHGPREWSGQVSGTQEVLAVRLESPADARYQVQATLRPHPSTGYEPVVDFLWVRTAGQSFTETT